MNTQQALPANAQMVQMITGFWTSCCIYNAAKLNIADYLAKVPQTAEQLAEATHTHAPSLYQVMRALASVGIFSEDGNGEFCNTALSETLKSDVPGSMKAMASDSKLLVIDAVIPAGNTTHPGKFMDINMMAMTGGKERTEQEFSALFSQAGLSLSKVIPTLSPTLSVLEVIKP